jgi:hypothetical protein
VSCLSVEELAGLYDGIFFAEKALRLRNHLAMCQRCCHEFSLLVDMQKQPLPRAFSGQVPKEIVSQAMEKRSVPKLGKTVSAPNPLRGRISDNNS